MTANMTANRLTGQEQTSQRREHAFCGTQGIAILSQAPRVRGAQFDSNPGLQIASRCTKIHLHSSSLKVQTCKQDDN